MPVPATAPFSTPVAPAYRLAAPTDLTIGTDGILSFLQVDAQGNLRVTEPLRVLIELRKIYLALVDGLTLDPESIRVRAIAGITDDLLAEVPSATVPGNPSSTAM